jgi:hypothetical protein
LPACTSTSQAAVDLAAYLIEQDAGRGIFRLHEVVRGRCACRRRACPNVGKCPAERWGHASTRTTRAVEQKFRLHPDAGIGLATGRGLLVLDFDVGRGGLESLVRLDETFPVLSDAPRVKTGGGGRHVYLRVSDGVYVPSRANALPDFPGVDVRCAGGFVVAPPSPHRTGARYEWEQRPTSLSGCPNALISLLQERETRRERGGSDRIRSRMALSPRVRDHLEDGIPLDAEGGQRGVVCALSRALLEVPTSVEDTAEQIWAALCKSEWSEPDWPWTREEVYEVVVDIEEAGRPALRNGGVRIHVPPRKRRER